MKKTERAYRGGEVIFREDEASRSAFVLLDGNVELAKAGDRGEAVLAVLPPGEIFGEMGIFDESTRGVTARAVGDVVVEVIPREDFLRILRSNPEAALAVIGKLIGRLRLANERLARGTPPKAKGRAAPAKRPKVGLLDRLFSAGGGVHPDRIEVQVAALAGDGDLSHSRRVVAALDKRQGLRARLLGRALARDPSADPTTQLTAAAATGRQWLVEAGADLLIWGEVAESGTTLTLRFVPAALEDEDRPGCFALAVALNLPVAFGPEFADILFATALAATTPRSEGKSLGLREALPPALAAAKTTVQKVAKDLTSRERAALHASFGNVAAAVARQRGAGEFYQVAAHNYRAALETLSPKENPLVWAITQRNLGAVLQALAERADEAVTLRASADCYRAALTVLTKAHFPREWAAAQNRLGWVLYRLDQSTGDTELVKQALVAFQAALQVYTRPETPRRWAEVMNNVALAAQMLGGQLRNAEVLEKAAAACRGALEVRTREAMPLLWAATQNNLGSALFLLGKLSRRADHLEGAAEAFRRAHELYDAYGASKMAAVAEKNLAHVRRLLADRAPRAAPRTHWADADFEGDPAAESLLPTVRLR